MRGKFDIRTYHCMSKKLYTLFLGVLPDEYIIFTLFTQAILELPIATILPAIISMLASRNRFLGKERFSKKYYCHEQ